MWGNKNSLRGKGKNCHTTKYLSRFSLHTLPLTNVSKFFNEGIIWSESTCTTNVQHGIMLALIPDFRLFFSRWQTGSLGLRFAKLLQNGIPSKNFTKKSWSICWMKLTRTKILSPEQIRLPVLDMHCFKMPADKKICNKKLIGILTETFSNKNFIRSITSTPVVAIESFVYSPP